MAVKKSNTRISITISESDWQKLTAILNETGETKSEFFRVELDTAYSLFKRFGSVSERHYQKFSTEE